MNPILNIVSVRVKNLHINPANPQDNTAFSSINKAKAHSRKLGGAGKVRAFRDKAEAFDFIQAYAHMKAVSASDTSHSQEESA